MENKKIIDKTDDEIILSLKKIKEFHDRVLDDLIAMSEKIENLKADLMENRHHADTAILYYEAYNAALNDELANYKQQKGN